MKKRNPKTLNASCYTYLELENKKHADAQGKKMFGSRSAYINALIAVDRGVLPNLGAWKADGEKKHPRKKRIKPKSSAQNKRRKAARKKVHPVIKQAEEYFKKSVEAERENEGERALQNEIDVDILNDSGEYESFE